MDTAADRNARAQPPPDGRQAAALPDDEHTVSGISGAGEATTAPEREPDDTALRQGALSRAAHELKTPLAVIKGSATTLLSNAGHWDPATQQELLQLIDAQVDRLHHLVNGLLDVWRLGETLLPHQLTPTSIETLLADLAARWRESAPAHALHVSLAPGLPPAPLDPERMRHAIERLVAYAAATAPDGMPIRIEARAAAGELTVRVARPGPTPPVEERAQLFEPIPRPGTEGTPMSGQALAEARAVVHAHGGRLIATPPLHGTGLVFELGLPVSPAPEPAIPEAALPRRAGVTHERPVLLIADDDPHLVRYLRANLEAQGYRPLVAPNCTQLARLLDLEQPDLVLLDASLDNRSGASTLDQLREYGDVPMIVLGRGDEAECVRALDMGAVDYLAKPFGLQELLARVRTALRATARPSTSEPAETIFRNGELTIDFAQRLVHVGGQAVQLSRTEYKLLRVLAQHVGRVLSHELLLERVWGPGYGQEVEFLWVYVRRLRRKIEPDPRCPCYIVTIPGVGYRLAQH